MEYNKENNTVILEIQEYSKLVNELELINNKVSELQKLFVMGKNNFSKTSSSDYMLETDLKNELQLLRKNKTITHKQYIVLAYILEHHYFSDAEVSRKVSVSYSSISQWKKKDLKFKDMYNKILMLKTI